MATILPFDRNLSVEQKWEICKNHYNRSIYKNKEGKRLLLNKRPSNAEVEDLFLKIGKMNENIEWHFNKKPAHRKRFFEKSGLIEVDNFL